MWHQLATHEKECLFPQKSGSDILDSVSRLATEAKEEFRRYQELFNMLSYEKIATCGNLSVIFIFKFHLISFE